MAGPDCLQTPADQAAFAEISVVAGVAASALTRPAAAAVSAIGRESSRPACTVTEFAGGGGA